jgi:hypothetical protein
VADDKRFAERYLPLLEIDVVFAAKVLLLKGNYVALAHALGLSETLTTAGAAGRRACTRVG